MTPSWLRLLPEVLRKRIESRDYLQNVLGNMGWLFADRIVRMGMGLLVGVWVARYLGPERLGILSYALAFVSLFSSIASMGLENVAVRDLVNDPSRKDDVLGTVFSLKVLGGAMAFSLAICTIIIVRKEDTLTHWLVGIIAAGLFFQALDAIDLWFQSQVISKYTVFAKSAGFIVISLAKIALILMKASLVYFAVAGLCEIIIGSFGLIVVYRRYGGSLAKWRFDYSTASRILADSWPLILSGVASMLYLRIDQIMLGNMIGNKEVGIYSVAVQITEVWYFIPMIIYSSVFPAIVEAREISGPLFYDRLQKLYNYMALAAYGIALPVCIFSGVIVQTLFGHSYERSSEMLSVLIWSLLFTNLGVARSAFLMSMNWTRIHFYTVALGCIINILLNIILIPKYRGMGAVISSCVAYWFAAHGSCFTYKPLMKTGHMLSKAIAYPKIWDWK